MDEQHGEGTADPAGAAIRLEPGMELGDLAVEASDCGQYLLLTGGGRLLAVVGAMGSDVETVEFADGRRYRVAELMEMLPG